MQKGVFLTGSLLFFISNYVYSIEHFELKKSQEYAHDIDIHLYDNGNHIGFVSYTKIFFLPFYIIHNLYVYPQYRRKGYGTKLLLYVCKIIEKYRARRAYIQPGPFEMINGQTIGFDSSYSQKVMQQLVQFYKKYGFYLVNPVISKAASVLYYIMGIHEDARYLMMKNISINYSPNNLLKMISAFCCNSGERFS
jgi:GNAT superfamily N-acetyltransferase